VEELVDLEDRLLVRWRFIISGQHSGIQGEQSISAIHTYREARLMLVEYFLDHEQARKSVGLQE
jgi:hypothetical protein